MSRLPVDYALCLLRAQKVERAEWILQHIGDSKEWDKVLREFMTYCLAQEDEDARRQALMAFAALCYQAGGLYVPGLRLMPGEPPLVRDAETLQPVPVEEIPDWLLGRG